MMDGAGAGASSSQGSTSALPRLRTDTNVVGVGLSFIVGGFSADDVTPLISTDDRLEGAGDVARCGNAEAAGHDVSRGPEMASEVAM